MGTPYKRVKITKKGSSKHAVGATIDVPSEEAEALITAGNAVLVGAGNAPQGASAPDHGPAKGDGGN